MNDLKITEKDAHERVAVLFHLPAKEGEKPKLIALSVKWILTNGPPKWPTTGEFLKYEGTHLIQ